MSAFRGWLDAWGTSWGSDGPPGFIAGAASFSLSAAGTLTSTGRTPAPGWRMPIFVPVPPPIEHKQDAFELMLAGVI